MSTELKDNWKIKHITDNDERIELRKEINGCNILIVIRKNDPVPCPTGIWNNNSWRIYQSQRSNIKISMNNSLWLSFKEWEEIKEIIWDAKNLLFEY